MQSANCKLFKCLRSREKEMIFFLLKLLFVNVLFDQLSCMEDGVSYIIGPGKVDCFHHSIANGTVLDFEMEVMKGGDLKATYRIIAPSGKVLAEEFDTTSVEKTIDIIENGVHDFCFDNKKSMFAEKVIYFDLGLFDDNVQMYHELNTVLKVDNSTSSETYDKIVKVTEALRRQMDTVSNLQGVYRAKSGRHMYILDSNISRVNWFSFASCLVIMLVGILQVTLVRNLFAENKR